MPRVLLGVCLLTTTLACRVEPMVLSPCAQDAPAGPPCWAARREVPIPDTQDDGITRFFAVGDMGVADPTTQALSESAAYVASLVKAACTSRGGCDFGLMLGDNIYPSGVEGPAQERFFEEMSRRYSDEWRLPLVYVLGNHDYDPYSPKTARARAELALISKLHDARGGAVLGRSHFFDLSAGNVDVFAWDTNYLVHACDAAVGASPECVGSGDAALRAIEASKAPFKIWIGHHPYWSNGQHGDAGEFEECLGSAICVGVWPGTGFRQLARQHLIGRADLMLSGHDHTLQAFTAPELRGTALVVSGAGAKHNPLARQERRRAARFEAGGTLGFSLIEATRERLTVTLFGAPVVDGVVPEAVSEGDSPAPLFAMQKHAGGSWVPLTTSAGP